MNKVLSHKFFSEYSPPEWTIMKACFCFFWCAAIASSVISNTTVPYPSGFARYINLSFLLSAYTPFIFCVFGLGLSALYVCEKWMKTVTILMFTLSLIVFTLEDSNGVLNRNSLYTMIFLAQWIAYLKNGPHLKSERIQYAIQIIAAGYVLAGISKLTASGLGWISSGPLISLQVLKNFDYSYFDSGKISDMYAGVRHADFILTHPGLIEALFASSLFLELFAWIIIKNKRRSFFYGLLLLGMHLGIHFFMNILITAVFFPMLIFLINPVYLGYLLYVNYIRPRVSFA